jgi:protein-S-isoprenylcysteine O-methyltransferase Ste14
MMKATNWEFQNRALLFGLIFAVSFPLYSFDQQNSTAALAAWLAPKLELDGDLLARLLFGLAAVLLIVAALVRTWASSYLHAEVVYAAQVKTASLVADGPYRRVRNPLYFANVLMAIGMGAMMSRTGFFVAVVAMFVFSYRLILREEAELRATQGESYERYRTAVRRLWPSLRTQVPASDAKASWAEGFKAEGWFWGFALSVIAFAVTLNLKVYFVILGATLIIFWVSSMLLQKKSKPEATDSSKPF